MLSKHLFLLYSYGHKAKGRHSSAVGGLAIALEEAISKMYCDQFLNQLAIAMIITPTNVTHRGNESTDGPRISIHQSVVENAHPLEWHQSLRLFWLLLDI